MRANVQWDATLRRPQIQALNRTDANTLFASLEQHLRTKDDTEMVLLKGHLVLEQVLNQLLLGYIGKEEDLLGLHLTFSKKLDLLVALSDGFHDREEIDQLREINRIRNKLAHNLDFTDFHSDLKRWACDVVAYTPKSIHRKSTYRNTLLKAFYFLAALLSGMARGRRDAMQLTEARANNSFKETSLRDFP